MAPSAGPRTFVRLSVRMLVLKLIRVNSDSLMSLTPILAAVLLAVAHGGVLRKVPTCQDNVKELVSLPLSQIIQLCCSFFFPSTIFSLIRKVLDLLNTCPFHDLRAPKRFDVFAQLRRLGDRSRLRDIVATNTIVPHIFSCRFRKDALA